MKLSAAAWIFAAMTLNACSAFSDMHSMKNKTNDMDNTTHDMKDSTDHVAKTSDTMAQTTDEMAKNTAGMKTTTEEMAKNTADMKTTMEEMAKRTTEMAATTAGLSAKTDVLTVEMANLYRDMRQGDAMRNRTDAIKSMSETKDQIAKLTDAGHYFMAFEFQLWKNSAEDNSASLDTMRRDAVDEFLREAHRFMPADLSLSPASSDNDMKNLYALVAAMHSVNSNSVAESPGSTGGMLELLRQGLAAKAAVEQGKMSYNDLPKYQFSVLQSENEVLYLINLRVNFLPAMVVTQLASKDGHALNELELVAAMLAPWDVQLEGKNVAQLATLAGAMQETLGAMQILKSVGAQPMLDDNFKALVKQANFSPDSYATTNPERNKLVMQLQGAFKALAAQ